MRDPQSTPTATAADLVEAGSVHQARTRRGRAASTLRGAGLALFAVFATVMAAHLGATEDAPGVIDGIRVFGLGFAGLGLMIAGQMLRGSEAAAALATGE